MSLPMYGIWAAIKYHFRADNHTYACVAALANGFDSANLINTTTCISWTSYSCYQDGAGVSYDYSAGIAAVIYCIMAVTCIPTHLGAHFFNVWIE